VKNDRKRMVLVSIQSCKLPNHIVHYLEGHVLGHTLPACIALVINVAVAAVYVASRRYFYQDGIKLHPGAPRDIISPRCDSVRQGDLLMPTDTKAPDAMRCDDENDIEVRRFNKLKSVAASILPGLTAEDIEVRGPRLEGRDPDLSGVHVRTPSGVVPLEELSLGYRTMFALSVDLTWRLFNAFPDSLEPVNESAIVLIDEVDLHLHPRWQREIARRLMSQFQNIQFIATTHSPITAQETLSEGGNVAVVRWENGEANIFNSPVPPGNWRFDQVLTDELFPGMASDRPQRVEPKLYERLELIRNSNRSVEQETRLRELDEFVASLPTAPTPSDQSFEELMMNLAKDFPSGVAR
jgi:hypothetical protein